MARKKSLRELPVLPLASLIRAKEHKTARLVEILRGVAISNQRENARAFYPVRQVARRFHVPLSTVARVYSQLEDEGLLTTIRGSKTILQGLSSGRHFSVRGFVGIAAASSLFVILQDYRRSIVRLRRELRGQGFAVATIFFARDDAASGRFERRIGKYDVDTLLWLRPDTSAKHVFASLTDSGIRVIGVRDGGAPTIRCRYEVHRDSAISFILRDWRDKSRIRSVIVLRSPEASASKEELLQLLLEDARLPCQFKAAGSQGPEEFLESLGNDKREAIIVPSQAAALFAFRAPEALMRLMGRTRVALTGGGIGIPFAQVKDVHVDVVAVDWQLFAERIAADLISSKAFDRGETTVIDAEPKCHVPLADYAEIV